MRGGEGRGGEGRGGVKRGLSVYFKISQGVFPTVSACFTLPDLLVYRVNIYTS